MLQRQCIMYTILITAVLTVFVCSTRSAHADTATDYYLRAVELHRTQQADTAIQVLRMALTEYPDDQDLRALLALIDQVPVAPQLSNTSDMQATPQQILARKAIEQAQLASVLAHVEQRLATTIQELSAREARIAQILGSLGQAEQQLQAREAQLAQAEHTLTAMQSSDAHREVQVLSAEVVRLRDHASQLEAWHEATSSRESELETRVARQDKVLQKAERAAAQALQARDLLQDDLQERTAQLATQQQAFAALQRSAERNGYEAAGLKQSQEQLAKRTSEAETAVVGVRKILAVRTQALESLQAEHAALRKAWEDITRTRTQLEHARVQLEQKVATQTKALQAAQRALQVAQQVTTDRDAMLAALQTQYTALEQRATRADTATVGARQTIATQAREVKVLGQAREALTDELATARHAIEQLQQTADEQRAASAAQQQQSAVRAAQAEAATTDAQQTLATQARELEALGQTREALTDELATARHTVEQLQHTVDEQRTASALQQEHAADASAKLQEQLATQLTALEEAHTATRVAGDLASKREATLAALQTQYTALEQRATQAEAATTDARQTIATQAREVKVLGQAREALTDELATARDAAVQLQHTVDEQRAAIAVQYEKVTAKYAQLQAEVDPIRHAEARARETADKWRMHADEARKEQQQVMQKLETQFDALRESHATLRTEYHDVQALAQERAEELTAQQVTYAQLMQSTTATQENRDELIQQLRELRRELDSARASEQHARQTVVDMQETYQQAQRAIEQHEEDRTAQAAASDRLHREQEQVVARTQQQLADLTTRQQDTLRALEAAQREAERLESLQQAQQHQWTQQQAVTDQAMQEQADVLTHRQHELATVQEAYQDVQQALAATRDKTPRRVSASGRSSWRRQSARGCNVQTHSSRHDRNWLRRNRPPTILNRH
jgi:chromosome segregation ATPase